MRWERLVRGAVAVAGVAGAIVGVATGQPAVAMAAIALVGWAVPWVREVELDKAAREVIRELPRGAGENTAVRRLKRVTGAPPTE